jgi:acetyltransferase-like isoleucine patch superfamily enzyme
LSAILTGRYATSANALKLRRGPASIGLLRAAAQPPALANRARLSGCTTEEQLSRPRVHIGNNVEVWSRGYIDPVFAWPLTVSHAVVRSWDVAISSQDKATWKAIPYTRVERVPLGAGAYIGTDAIRLHVTSVWPSALVAPGSVVRGSVGSNTIVAGTLVGRFRQSHR